MFLFHSKCPQSSIHTAKATSGPSQPEVSCSVCGMKKFTLRLCKCSITGTFQLTPSQVYLPWENQCVLPKAKRLEWSPNYLWEMYDTPTKKKNPQILTSSSHYPVICLFHEDKKWSIGIFEMYGYFLFPFWFLFYMCIQQRNKMQCFLPLSKVLCRNEDPCITEWN